MAVAAPVIPREIAEPFGGLMLPDETLEQALRRIETKPNSHKILGSTAGQSLLEAINSGRGSEVWSSSTPPPALGVVPVPVMQVHSPRPELREIPLERIDIGRNVRTDPGELDDLAESILEHGVLQPVKAMPHPAYGSAEGRYLLIWGQRRVLAARLAGLERIPAIVVDHVHAWTPAVGPDPKRSIEQLVENLIRADLNDLDEARALREVLDADPKLSQAELARRLGRDPSWVSNTLVVLEAPKAVQKLVAEGKLTGAHVKAIRGLDAQQQEKLATNAAAAGDSAHELESNARWYRERKNDDERSKKLVADAIKHGLAKLEEAGIAKDVRLWVVAHDWRVSDAAVQKAIKAAGYTVQDTWPRTTRWSKCDCPGLQLSIQDGKGSTLETACFNENHWKAFDAEQRAEQRAKTAAQEADRRAFTDAISKAFPAEVSGVVGRLILRALEGYYGKTWTEYSKLSDAQVRRAIVAKLSSDEVIRRASYNGDSKRLPVKTVLKELGAIEPADVAPAKHPRRRPPEAAS